MNRRKLEELTDQSLEILSTYLSKVDPSDNENRKAKTAQTILSTYAKIEQTSSAREATRFFVARELSDNPQELKRFLKASAPQLLPQSDAAKQ